MQSVCTGPKAGYRVSIDRGHLISGLMTVCTYSYSVIVCSRYFQFHLLPQHSALLHLTSVRLCPSCSAARTQASHCHQQRPSRTFATGDSFQAVLQATILLLCAQIQSLPFRAYFETIIKSFCSQFP